MKSAILIIDLQIGLFDEPGEPFDFENIIFKANKLTTEVSRFFWPHAFLAGSDGCA